MGEKGEVLLIIFSLLFEKKKKKSHKLKEKVDTTRYAFLPPPLPPLPSSLPFSRNFPSSPKNLFHQDFQIRFFQKKKEKNLTIQIISTNDRYLFQRPNFLQPIDYFAKWNTKVIADWRVATQGPSTITIGRVQRYVAGMRGTYGPDEEEAKKELWMSMVGEGSR